MKTLLKMLFIAIVSLPSASAQAREHRNQWTKLDGGKVEGMRFDFPLVYEPKLRRFMILGGRAHWAEYAKPRAYDELAFDATEGKWENWYPRGKDWGPKFGSCSPPRFRNESFDLKDVENNVRPNWTVYGNGFSLGQKVDYDIDNKQFVFYAGGRTFSYDPADRQWKDLNPPTDPEKKLGGVLLWGSMCYDQHKKRFILFGGGNIQTERGDAGTWTYTPSTNTWKQLQLDKQPPPRANSRLVYDPIAKKVVLFGGDQLDRLIADTWTFDVVTGKWEERKPSRCPSPRAGHALLWLPKSKKVLLLGGYGYASEVGYIGGFYSRPPMEAWIYDTAANRWDLIAHIDDLKNSPQAASNVFLRAAVNEEDTVAVVASPSIYTANETWLLPIDAAKIDEEGTTKYGGKPDDTIRRTGPYDPAWYHREVPPVDPKQVEVDLKLLPPNRWILRPTPKLPRPNMDWGSAVFDPDHDLILRFSGGHSAYSGTAPQVYDIKTDRYSIPFAPEIPLEYVGSNDQVSGEWSFKGNPWMAMHTYKSTGYDSNLKSLVFVPHQYTYFFDPKKGKWSRNAQRNPYRPHAFINLVCSTPRGAVVWADDRNGKEGLWLLDSATRTWKALPLKGTLPTKGDDSHGMAYDSKRDRLLLFSRVGKNKGDVAAYDLKTGAATWLNPTGKERAAVSSRETIYLPEVDGVLIGARIVDADDKPSWLLYDCEKNAWFGVRLTGADPIGEKPRMNFNNSMGLMYDPNRKLVWAVGQNSHVHVLRFDPKKTDKRGLK